ncbi:MAG: endolytic transglycosylase MltG [Roseiflexaceae bacterium]
MARALRALFLGIGVLSLAIACISFAVLSEIRRPAGTNADPVEFIVEPGDSTSAIATRLGSEELVRQPLLFTLLVRMQGLDGQLQAGRYILRQNMSMGEIIAALQISRVEEIQVTIVEGSRLEEIAEQIGDLGLISVDQQLFLETARNGAAFQADHFLLSNLPPGASLEGYLFPDTYRFAVTASVTEVVETMLDRFDQQFATFEKEIQVSNANVHQIVTMASIIQREAAREDEMGKISSVFWNRLKPEYLAETGGGKLQADPTVQYVLGQPGTWWPKLDTLSAAEINSITSPYNTRATPGLPPGPIAAPGLAALRAAAQPDTTAAYLYFVASCTDPGAHNFAATFEEFQRFEQEYLNCR